MEIESIFSQPVARFVLIECYAMLSGEEPQHTDLSTVIECYAISGGEEPQHTDFQL